MKHFKKWLLIIVAVMAVLLLVNMLIYSISWEDVHISAKEHGEMLNRKDTLGSIFFLMADAETGEVKLLHYVRSPIRPRCRLAEIIDVGTDGLKSYGFGDYREIFAVRIEDNTIKVNPESVKKRGLHITF